MYCNIHSYPISPLQLYRSIMFQSEDIGSWAATLVERCLCVTVFQMGHFPIAYQCSWWSCIAQLYKMGCWWWPYFQCSNRKELKTVDSSALQMHNISVAMGKNPHNNDYNQSRMRSHLEECFEKEELSLFSPSLVPVKRSRLRHLFVKVYCFCKRPESYDDMVECEGCSTWFHFKCVGLCSSSNTDNWKCSTCFTCMYWSLY